VFRGRDARLARSDPLRELRLSHAGFFANGSERFCNFDPEFHQFGFIGGETEQLFGIAIREAGGFEAFPFFGCRGVSLRKMVRSDDLGRVNPVDDAPFVRFVSNPQFVAALADYFERFAQPKTGLHSISAVYRY